jgi:hypothetical protein
MLHSSASQNARSRSLICSMARSGIDINDTISLHASLKKGEFNPMVRSKLRRALRRIRHASP